MARSKRSIAMANKRRGRGYQTTLAKMVGGMNIGTLGGEDVMHDRFSFEAKTRQKGNALETNMLLAEEYYDGKPVVVTWIGVWAGVELSMLRYNYFAALDGLEFNEYILMKKRSIVATMMKQAQRNSPEGKEPIVCVHTLNRRYEQDIVVLDKRLLNVLLCECGGKSIPVKRLARYLILKKEQDYGRKNKAKFGK